MQCAVVFLCLRNDAGCCAHCENNKIIRCGKKKRNSHLFIMFCVCGGVLPRSAGSGAFQNVGRCNFYGHVDLKQPNSQNSHCLDNFVDSAACEF